MTPDIFQDCAEKILHRSYFVPKGSYTFELAKLYCQRKIYQRDFQRFPQLNAAPGKKLEKEQLPPETSSTSLWFQSGGVSNKKRTRGPFRAGRVT